MFPNPSRGSVKVEIFDGITVYGITVYGITGSVLVNTNNINELEAALNNLSSGVYTVKVDSERGGQTLKVVLTK